MSNELEYTCRVCHGAGVEKVQMKVSIEVGNHYRYETKEVTRKCGVCGGRGVSTLSAYDKHLKEKKYKHPRWGV